MSTGWENHEPAPLEFFHGRLFDLFHELRKKKGENPERTACLNGIELGDIIAQAKTETYAKYPKQVNSKAIPKTEM